MAEFVLNVLEIDEAGKDYDFPVTGAWLASVLAGTDVAADEAGPEGHVWIHAQRQGADIVIQGHVTAALKTPCARCLEDAHIAVDAEFGSLLTARGEDYRPEPDELELTPEELEREFYAGDRIDLDPVVRENLLLEVPIKPLCAEDCAGIPVPASVAGPADLSADAAVDGVDPRLAPLMKLVGKVKPTEE